jgi:valyl-tRNA synthetase
MSDLPKNYNPQEVENKLQLLWEESKIYKWDENGNSKNSFIVDTPPPTVSGTLHMGHVFSYTQADFVVRYQRMKGKNVFYPIGFDDNGLPTERLVEKEKGIKASSLERSEFIKLCKEVVENAENEFRKLFKSIGISFDWSQEYQTINDNSRKISQLSFIDLYNKGFIELRSAPTFWDPVDRTAIAQAEIEDKEKAGVMYDIKFDIKSGGQVTIATTRPELICACVGLLYHPDDERYKSLQGQTIITPIFGHEVQVYADTDVDMEKGTGLVMCCTFGDIQDVAWWKKHKLAIKECITLEGKMQNAGVYDGLYAKDVKKKIIEDLKLENRVEKEVEVKQFVKCAERSGAPLELITTKQWYIKLLDYKEDILEKARECKWNPEYMRVRLENWVEGLNQDWCISRQRYFGVPFPVWYSKRPGEEGKILIAEPDMLPIDPLVDLPKGYSKDEVIPDKDVMDTWATSSVSPQLNSLGISNKLYIDAERHKKLFPADLRPQAHEIIRTWAFYTIVKSLYHSDSIPWKNLMISGWCLAADKTKMSKSKGNIVTPTELIQSKGADIVRYWASNSKLGVDIIYSEEIFKIGNKLLNKLWNASKFVQLHLANIEGKPTTVLNDIITWIFEPLDLWILSRLYKTIEDATNSFEKFEYCDARVVVENFFWKDFCDNYLEIVKARVYNDDPTFSPERQSGIFTLHHILKTLYRLFAPFMPFITDELNAAIFGGDSVHKSNMWPNTDDYYYNEESEKQGFEAINILELIRKYKSLKSMALNAPLSQIYCEKITLSSSLANDLKNAVNCNQIIFGELASTEVNYEHMESEDKSYIIKVVA